jgi:hypothetical protein
MNVTNHPQVPTDARGSEVADIMLHETVATDLSALVALSSNSQDSRRVLSDGASEVQLLSTPSHYCIPQPTL